MNEYTDFPPNIQAVLAAVEEGDGCAVCVELEALIQTRRTLGAAGRGMSILEIALEYGAAGIAVIPCEPASKEPIWSLVPKDIGLDRKPVPRSGGIKKATRDPAKITEWWTMRPDAMIGAATGPASGFWAIDPDVPKPAKNGHADKMSADGTASWAKLKAEHGGHEPTIEVMTPSGGRHIYFKANPARPLGNSEGALSGLGINVRGEGGYVIVPPSRRWPDGKLYEANQPLSPGAIAEAPPWLYELVSPRRKLPPPTPDGVFPFTPENARKLRDALSYIPADARDLWLKVGAALNTLGHEWGSVAREIWDEWSQTEPGSFDVEDQDATWKGFDPARPGGATVGTIFFEAKERGWVSSVNAPFFEDRAGAERDGQLPAPNPIKLLSYAEMIALPEGEFLIRGVIVRRAKNVLFGLSNAFKSFMATDMGGSVATGCSYHGMAVKKCPVIYVANEGAIAIGRKRIPAWMAAHEIPQSERANIYLMNVETILPNEISRNNLLAAIRSIVEPGEDFFLIIDVLRGTMTGSDSDDEAAAAWTSAAEIFVKEGATILTLTHSPYSDDGRIRGSSHLWGSFEGRLHAEGEKEKRTCVVKVDRFKDHDSNGQWGFQLDEVEIEEHPGETSLVPRLDGEVKPKKGKVAAKLTARAINALDALRYALDEVGALPPTSNHIPGGVKTVTLTQWRAYFDRRTTLDKPDSRLKAFDAGTEKLKAEKVIGIWDVYAWIV